MIKSIIILLILAIFFVTKGIIYQYTDIKGLPKFLNYRPFNCYKCCSFWALNIIYASMIYISNEWIFAAGNVLACLDAIARIIDEKINTIKIEDIKKEN